MVHRRFRGRTNLRASVLMPWAIPTAVTAVMWQWMFRPAGVINAILGHEIIWTGPVWSSRLAIIIADTWKTAPFISLLVLAAMQPIPDEVYEAARVDGASAWQRTWRITLPLVKPALAGEIGEQDAAYTSGLPPSGAVTKRTRVARPT